MKKFFLTAFFVLALVGLVLAQPGFDPVNPNQPDKLRPQNPGPKRFGPDGFSGGDRIRPFKRKPMTEEERKKFEEEMQKRQIQMLKMMLKRLKENLKLSDEQIEALEKILTESLKKQKAIRDEMRKKLEELKRAQEEELKKLLGDKYDEFKKLQGRRNRFKIQPRDRNANPRNPFGMLKKLGLSEEQQKALKEAFEKFRNKQKELRESLRDSNVKPEEMREKFKKLYEEFEAELKKLLTEEQWQKYQELKKNFSKRFNPNNRRNRPKRLKDFLKDLGLSEEQEKAVKEAIKELREAVKDLINGGTAPEQMREKIKALQEELEAKLKKLLTPEQFEKYKKWREQGRKFFKNRRHHGENNPGKINPEPPKVPLPPIPQPRPEPK